MITEGHAQSVMWCYNALHGMPVCADTDLLNGRLRHDWGFKGYVVTDCDAIEDMYLFHFYRPTPEDNAAAALKAGTDLNCGVYYRYLKAALDKKVVTSADIDRATVRLFAARARLGLDGTGSPYDAIGADQIHTQEARQLALRAAREGSIVLLKNKWRAAAEDPQQGSPSSAPMRICSRSPRGANYHGTPIDPGDRRWQGLRAVYASTTYAQGSTIAEGVAVSHSRNGADHGIWFLDRRASILPTVIFRGTGAGTAVDPHCRSRSV